MKAIVAHEFKVLRAGAAAAAAIPILLLLLLLDPPVVEPPERPPARGGGGRDKAQEQDAAEQLGVHGCEKKQWGQCYNMAAHEWPWPFFSQKGATVWPSIDVH